MPVKLVVSTISVLPSHRPRESPIHWRIFGDRCGRPSSGMRRVKWRISLTITTYPGHLHELIVGHQGVIRRIVGEARKHRRSDRRPPETAIHQWPILRTVGGMQLTLTRASCESLLRRRRQRRNLPVRRIHDQRRSGHRDDLRVRVPPFAAIRTAEIGGRPAPAVVAIPPFQHPLLVLGRFLRGEDPSRQTPGAVPAASGSRWSRSPASRAVRPACAAASNSSRQVVAPWPGSWPARRAGGARTSMKIASAAARDQDAIQAHGGSSLPGRGKLTARGEYCSPPTTIAVGTV